MANIKKYLIIAGIVISLAILIIGLILSGRDERILAQFIAKKQKLKDLQDSNKEKLNELNKQEAAQDKKIADTQKGIKTETGNLADLKKEQDKITNTPVTPVATPTQPEAILDQLKDIKNGK